MDVDVTAPFPITHVSFSTLGILVCLMFLKVVFAFGWIKFKDSIDEKRLKSFLDGYADCMVDTYFYGYLRKIIPDHGTGGLQDKIMQYKEKEHLSDQDFPFHKIFILICSSGFVPPDLGSIDKDRIEARKNLDPLILKRAGTHNRVYSTGVYKIRMRNLKDHITVAMEGAPPLLTLSDSCKENYELRMHKKEIIELFYQKLSKKLKENEEFANSYELLFYNDDPDKPPTLADEIILKHVDRGL